MVALGGLSRERYKDTPRVALNALCLKSVASRRAPSETKNVHRFVYGKRFDQGQVYAKTDTNPMPKSVTYLCTDAVSSGRKMDSSWAPESVPNPCTDSVSQHWRMLGF